MANETIAGGGRGSEEWALPVFGGYSATGALLWGFDKTGALTSAGAPKLSGIENTLTAHAGGGQASATLVTAADAVHIFTVVATANDSAALPLATGSGAMQVIHNQAANSLQLFGSGTDTINGVVTATGVAVAAGKSALCIDYAAGLWLALIA